MTVVPNENTLPAGTPLRVTVTLPELSDATGQPSSASDTTTDVVPVGTARETLGGAASTGFSVSRTVTFCVFTVAFPKTSVAVHVTSVTPIRKRLPSGTPDRVTLTPMTLSVAVADPSAESLM